MAREQFALGKIRNVAQDLELIFVNLAKKKLEHPVSSTRIEF
jgi:hypothetical protein